MKKTSIRSIVLTGTFLATTAFILNGCGMADERYNNIDREAQKSVQDYRDTLRPQDEKNDPFANAGRAYEAPIPSMMNSAGKVSGAGKYTSSSVAPLVTVSLNQTIPLRDALFDLAQQADYDIVLDPSITGAIIYSARNRPFDEVIEQISDVAGLYYEFSGNSVKLTLDRPYFKRYKIDYLNLVRASESEVATSVSVATDATGGGGGGGSDNGSEQTVSTESETDFWSELETNMAQILGDTQTASQGLRTETDPEVEISTTQVAPGQTVPGAAATGQQAAGGAAPAGATNDPNATAAATPATAQQPTPAQPVVNMTVSSSGAAATSGGTAAQEPSFVVNRMAGVVSVFGTSKQHKEVEEYLKEVEKSVSAQVLIEAKILEVSLSDEFSSGIDWDLTVNDLQIGSGSSGAGISPISFDANAPALQPLTNSAFRLPIDITTNFASLNLVSNAISRFGTVRALSSPRITVMNNQSAVLNVAENRVFFTLELEEEEDEDTNQVTLTIESEINTVPEGVMVNVQPSINMDTGNISMFVRPSITRIDETVDDPGTALIAQRLGINNLSSEIPIVNVQEVDTIVRMKSGQVLVMGGLMQDRTVSTQESVPIAGELPILGNLFRSQGDKIQKTELVILIRAVILDRDGNIHPYDEELYRSMSYDRRPFGKM